MCEKKRIKQDALSLFLLNILFVFIENIWAIFSHSGFYDYIILFIINVSVGYIIYLLIIVLQHFKFFNEFVYKSIYSFFGVMLVFIYLIGLFFVKIQVSDFSLSFKTTIVLLFCLILSSLIFYLINIVKKKLFFDSVLKYILVLFIFALIFIIFKISNNSVENNSKNKDLKNIILFTVDALRYDYVFDKPVKLNLSNIDFFTKDSLSFSNYFSVTNTTNPSFASLFTGKYQDVHKLYINGYKISNNKLIHFPQLLKQLGYYTAAFSSNVKYESGIGKGFDYFYHIRKGLTLNGNARKFRGVYELLFLKIREKFSKNNLINLSLDWVKKNKNKPFFLWVHIYDTHLPYKPSKKIKKLFITEKAKYSKFLTKNRWNIYNNKIKLNISEIENIRGLYKGEVQTVDDKFGVFIKKIKELGLYKNSLIVFSSDHGEALYEKKFWFGHSKFMFDPIIRIPLIIKVPIVNDVKKENNINSTFSNIYLGQTILDILEINKKFSNKTMINSIKGDVKKLNSVISLMYEKSKNKTYLSKVVVNDGFNKVMYDGKKIEKSIIINGSEIQIISKNDKIFEELINKAIYIFNNKKKSVKSQKISEKEKQRLRTMGYLN